MSSPTFLTETNVKFDVSIRLGRPIEGCELSSHAYLSVKGANMDNTVRAKILDSNPHTFVHKWYRSAKNAMCANPTCKRANSHEPNDWFNESLGSCSIMCAVCEKANIPKHRSKFCSMSCFKGSWKQHAVGHSRLPPPAPKDNSEKGNKDTSAAPDDANTWTSCGNDTSSATYTPTSDDVGCVLKVEVTAVSQETDKPLTGLVSGITLSVLQMPSLPQPRSYIEVPSTSLTRDGQLLRVMSFNVLADIYATKQAYSHCDTWALSWPYRRTLILRHLTSAAGVNTNTPAYDVICLQEMLSEHYEKDIYPVMQQYGYEGVFTQKTRKEMGMYGKVDGCATFWNKTKLAKIEMHVVELNELALKTASRVTGISGEPHRGKQEVPEKVEQHRRCVNRLMKDNIAQILVFDAITPEVSSAQGPGISTSSSDTPSEKSKLSSAAMRHAMLNANFCVVNTHLYSNANRSDVKLWQTIMLLQEVDSLINRYNRLLTAAGHDELGAIMCGDFNSEPSSSVYEAITTGVIATVPKEAATYDALSEKFLPSSGTRIRSSGYSSSMKDIFGAEPAFTNYTNSYKGTLDYIFYVPARIQLKSALELPSQSEVTQYSSSLPGPSHPSDHLMLCCEMRLVGTSNGRPSNSMQRPNLGGMHYGPRG